MRTLAAAICLLACLPAAAQDGDSIYGRWRSIESKFYRADGSSTSQGGSCNVDYAKDRLVSECTLPDGRKSRLVYRMVELTPTAYEVEVLENPSAPQTVGVRNKVEYRMARNMLFIATKPALAGSPVVRIESVLVRE